LLPDHLFFIVAERAVVMTSRFLLHTACAAALALGGCASFDGLAPQAQPNDPNQRTLAAVSPSAASAPWPRQDWWQGFQDPQLTRLIQEGLAGNPTLKVADARMRRAAAEAGLAEAKLYPRLDASASVIGQRFDENSLYPSPPAGEFHTNNRMALEGSYSLDLWGGHEAAFRAALGQVQASAVEAQAARLDLADAIAQAYVRLALAFEQRQISQELLRQKQEIFTLSAKLVSAGLITEIEQRQAEAAIAATKAEIAGNEEAIALTRQELAALVGSGPERGASIERPRLRLTQAIGLPSTLPAELLGRRPEIVARRWRIEAAGHTIEAAKTEFYPNLNLSAFLGVQSIGLASFLKAGSLMVGAGPAVTLPIFDAGRLRSNLAAADADLDLLVEQYNAALVEALREIAGQLTSWQANQSRLEQEQLATRRLDQAYRLALLRYREGVANYLTVLSAEGDLIAARRREAEARVRQYTLSIGLIHALGGGFTPQSLPPAPTAARS